MSRHRLKAALRQLAGGGLIAYPTEAVFGLGCDPDNPQAIERLLQLKQRPAHKGLILIGGDFGQLLPYIDATDIPNLHKILKTWPGPVTWLIKARPSVPFWLRGDHDSIAVRVTAHAIAARLCKEFGKPLVSTSANPSNDAPARSAFKTRLYFGQKDVFIVKGKVGGLGKPTAIFDARTLKRAR
ncbi:MAG: Sua5/YciO/YrdC/YwlC family protein [Blastocatellia bacterium]